ncbi:MAG: P-II family nitrogen regulator [Armatimonadota bacterium]
MGTFQAKLVTIITEALLEQELTQRLVELGATGYTVSDARGKGHRGVRDAGWEHGANIRVEVLCDEETANRIAAFVVENYYRDYAMVVFIDTVEVLRENRF